MDTLRPTSLRQDPSEPVDIGCGILRPVRSSALASILEYAHDVAHAPSRIDAKPFEFDCLVITTRDHWEFRGRAGRSDVDAGSMTVGVAGDTYGCRHYRGCADANIIVGLRAGAVDPDYPPLFAKQVVPARSARRLASSAVEALTADAFDTLVFTLFDEASAASNARRPAGSPLRMQRAKRFIERHAFEKLAVADVAAEVGLSPFTVLRQFRAATGSTPYAYLLELRLEQAKRLLAKSHATVESVAHAVGFDDLAHFSRWFRIRTGYSATVFRRESGPADGH
jgi:AraC-like DNA-binding protein